MLNVPAISSTLGSLLQLRLHLHTSPYQSFLQGIWPHCIWPGPFSLLWNLGLSRCDSIVLFFCMLTISASCDWYWILLSGQDIARLSWTVATVCSECLSDWTVGKHLLKETWRLSLSRSLLWLLFKWKCLKLVFFSMKGLSLLGPFLWSQCKASFPRYFYQPLSQLSPLFHSICLILNV